MAKIILLCTTMFLSFHLSIWIARYKYALEDFVTLGARCPMRQNYRAGFLILPACVQMVLPNATPEEALAAIARGRSIMFARRPIPADRAVL